MANYKVSFTVTDGALEKAVARIFCDGVLDNPLAGSDFRRLLDGLTSESDKALVRVFWFMAHANKGADIDSDVLGKIADGLWELVADSNPNPFYFDWITEPFTASPRTISLGRGLRWVEEIVWQEKRNVPVTVTMQRIAERENVSLGTVENYYYLHPKGVAHKNEQVEFLRDLKHVYPVVCDLSCPGCVRCEIY